MSGRLPSRTGAYDNAAEFRADIPTFAHYLRRAGYRTILSGKMHFCGPDQLHGFEQRLTTDIYPADFGWTPDWDRPLERPSWYHNMRSVIDAGMCVRTNQMDFDDEVVFAAERAIYDHGARQRPAPVLPRGLLDPPARPVRDPASAIGTSTPTRRSTCRGSGSTRRSADAARAAPLARLRHGRSRGHRRSSCAPRAAPITVRSPMSTTMSAASAPRSPATGLADDTVIDRHLRSRRDAGRARLLVQDELLRRRGCACRWSCMRRRGSRPRRVTEAVSLVDLLPTLVDLAAEAPTPARRANRGAQPAAASARARWARRGARRVSGRRCGRRRS